MRLWCFALALPTLSLAAWLVYLYTHAALLTAGVTVLLAAAWAFVAFALLDRLFRPLQTLANVVAALREDDFSFRARGGVRGDSLGDLALEVNALASTLQQQRTSALDALTLVERVLTSMQSPVLAFDQAGHLRLLNAAATNSFGLPASQSLGRHATALALEPLLLLPDHGLLATQGLGAGAAASSARWSVRRTTFRLHGLPHTLLVLTDVAAALREEERDAWQRLIRVLGHEINNSLTPIKSIAGSLGTRVQALTPPGQPATPAAADLLRGLTVIEDRASSLNRFLQAYQCLSRLPAPQPRAIRLAPLLTQVAQVETRLAISLRPGPELTLFCDSDQVQQALINLVQNAGDAALAVAAERSPSVEISWSATATEAVLLIVDNGHGIGNAANLFVPFYTTKVNGSGIGLVLSQQIVNAHGGTLRLTANPDAPGSTARLSLPLALPAREVKL